MVLRNKWTSLVNISYEKVTKAKSALFTAEIFISANIHPLPMAACPALRVTGWTNNHVENDSVFKSCQGAVQLSTGIFPQRIHADASRTCELRRAQQPRIMCARTLDMNHTRRGELSERETSGRGPVVVKKAKQGPDRNPPLFPPLSCCPHRRYWFSTNLSVHAEVHF